MRLRRCGVPTFRYRLVCRWQTGAAKSLDDQKSNSSPPRLSAVQVYRAIQSEGEDELARPNWSLWWSGIGAGLAIAASVVGRAALHDKLPDNAWRPFIENFGYCVGFVIVILGRIQLFTENTITVILPLMARPSFKMLTRTARLWLIVFVANILGAIIAALLTYYGSFTPAQAHAAVAVAEPLTHKGWVEMLLEAIPAGFLVASIVWMIPNARGFEIWVILLATYVIAIGGYVHIIVGAMEVAILFLAGQMSLFDSVFVFMIPVLIGNVLGGTALFSLLAYGQVRHEIH
ncbi:formate/nitrite transporter family protein [Salinisphaera sp. USBA-960]|nr:formate/nitrite transporter family protein [Salifodinibacter halophilus]NNC25629.1 formate/nitrite transporter family protein [Salifodinibacter halophilus]